MFLNYRFNKMLTIDGDAFIWINYDRIFFFFWFLLRQYQNRGFKLLLLWKRMKIIYYSSNENHSPNSINPFDNFSWIVRYSYATLIKTWFLRNALLFWIRKRFWRDPIVVYIIMTMTGFYIKKKYHSQHFFLMKFICV